MKPNRRLALRRETLTDLSADELTFGGAAAPGLSFRDGSPCSAPEDTNPFGVLLALSVHWHCSWSCI